MTNCEVLIVGAGPTGLVLALWLTHLGVAVRIVDKASAPGTTSRALAVQARTLELYRQLDLTEEVLQQGHRVPAINLWVKGHDEARISFEAVSGNLTPYGPFIFPQDLHERLLIARLEALGIQVARSVELLSFEDHGDRVLARLREASGEESTAGATYIAGCDGARSVVRQRMGTGFPGGTYQQIFYVADVQGAGPAFNGELHVDLDEADFLMIFPLKGEGRARLVGTVRGERAENPEQLRFEDISDRAIRNMKVEVRKLNWFSTYRVHHRVTEHFGMGRAFLLGDAAHIHSPAGGQGMNTGIGDAINLAWKLKAVLRGQAPESLLGTYEVERRSFARKLVSTTDKGFTFATAEGPLANFIRTRMVPLVVPPLFKFEAMRHFLFTTVAQIAISYRESAISAGHAGDIRGGDRLPWVVTSTGDNFDSLRIKGWQLHVYGSLSPQLRAYCSENRLALQNYPWESSCREAGLCQNAMYLIRPDAYVGLADERQDPQILRRYAAEHRLVLV